MNSVDVIVPCYRYAHFLRECVRSILGQSGPSVRVLIIDDASPDDTSEVADDLAREDSRITFLRHTTNRGHIATFNEGMEWASADYMLILSADDYLLPGALNRTVSLMDANPAVSLTFGNAIRLDECGIATPINSVIGKADWRVIEGLKFIELSGSTNIVPTPTAVARTQVQRKLGGYRKELTHTGDMEMWLRLAAHGSVGMVKAYQAVYRRHAGNMSLAYMADGFLPEIQQRKAALDSFFQSCGHLLPNAQALERKFCWSLSRTAVGLASLAFDEGKTDVSEHLSDFALDICPRVKRSPSWLKLTYRRAMGYEAWCIVQRAATGILRMGVFLKHSAARPNLPTSQLPELQKMLSPEGHPAQPCKGTTLQP